jgi:hypothetical protein
MYNYFIFLRGLLHILGCGTIKGKTGRSYMSNKEKVQVVVLAQLGQTLEALLLKTNEQRGLFWQNITGSVERGESFSKAAER